MLSSQEKGKEIETRRAKFHQQSYRVKLGYRFFPSNDLYSVVG